jgi:hypothetical protein
MEETLRTLKDIKRGALHKGWIDEKELRQEAVKWVKHFLSLSNQNYSPRVIAFMDFFNLTEEELK